MGWHVCGTELIAACILSRCLFLVVSSDGSGSGLSKRCRTNNDCLCRSSGVKRSMSSVVESEKRKAKDL